MLVTVPTSKQHISSLRVFKLRKSGRYPLYQSRHCVACLAVLHQQARHSGLQGPRRQRGRCIVRAEGPDEGRKKSNWWNQEPHDEAKNPAPGPEEPYEWKPAKGVGSGPKKKPKLRVIEPIVIGNRTASGTRTTPSPDMPPPPEDNVSDLILAVGSNFMTALMPGAFKELRKLGAREQIKDLNAPRTKPKWKPGVPVGYGEWGCDVELGDDWTYRPGTAAAEEVPDPRVLYPGTDTPRDSWLRPIVDPQGVFDRIAFDRAARERRLEEEARLNALESREAVIFAGVWLFLIPFGLGWFVSRGIAEPLIVYIHEAHPSKLALTPKMKLEGAKFLKSEKLRLRLDAAVGKAPPLNDEFLFHHLQHAAKEFEHEKQEEIRTGLVNTISDSITLSTFFGVLIAKKQGREAMASAFGRIAQGLSQTGKAFIIILVADILMGYHSEEGWTAAIELLSEHYNAEIGFPPIAIFVSTVPVIIDAYFKYWLFKNLNRTDPSASVTLKEMDRH